MPDQLKLDDAYMSIAVRWGEMSCARRKQVGCIIVKDGQIISDGYNGTPYGFDNDCEFSTRFGWETKPEVLHAESNAITKLAKSTQSSQGATMYITLSPCFDCAKLIIQSGITRVIYGEEYKSLNGVELLQKASIDCLLL
ncbi:CMP deaminase [archaeon]|jgi:dCMP deaminase|nr:CMP deaminase [archaeon]|tara:strand:+ start:159 stop:578 length:420 start_codon:yes stop_codon:yes gene_type:complete